MKMSFIQRGRVQVKAVTLAPHCVPSICVSGQVRCSAGERSGGLQSRENRAGAASNFKDAARLRQIGLIEEIGAQIRCPRGLLKITMMPIYFSQSGSNLLFVD